MALWFAGAQQVQPPSYASSRLHGKKIVTGYTNASTPGNIETCTVYKPHGRAHRETVNTPSKTCLDELGPNDREFYVITPGDKRGRKAVEIAPPKPEPRPKPLRPIQQTPFALGDAEADPKPVHGQKRHITPPKNNQYRPGQNRGEDMFVLKRSRTPPASERNRVKPEGFCVLHGFNDKTGKFSRENMTVVPLDHHGKGNFQWERQFAERREEKENRLEAARALKCQKAKERESMRPIEEHRHLGKARARTPPPSRGTPYALELPVANQPVGVAVYKQHATPRRHIPKTFE